MYFMLIHTKTKTLVIIFHFLAFFCFNHHNLSLWVEIGPSFSMRICLAYYFYFVVKNPVREMSLLEGEILYMENILKVYLILVEIVYHSSTNLEFEK